MEGTMLQKLNDNMERLPEDQGFDEFKDVPVECFAAALLAGCGWKEGMGIRKNAKEHVKIWEIKRRIAKEGLGFVGDALVRSSNDKDKKKNEKKGEERCLRKLKETKIQREDRGPKRTRDRNEVDQRKVSWL
ncbi:protein MOS2-like [Vigna radiata var. radiata]|uniref:Protein MOS2-like n=1 Tax=Vigna radiata var. radiata TaxID=3916 RepID=A0A1S3TE03_VIGRR|nr:protein MOS2-like [Vigna radiata var. radiata]